MVLRSLTDGAKQFMTDEGSRTLPGFENLPVLGGNLEPQPLLGTPVRRAEEPNLTAPGPNPARILANFPARGLAQEAPPNPAGLQQAPAQQAAAPVQQAAAPVAVAPPAQDPAQENAPSLITDKDLAALRGYLPNLKSFSDSLLKSMDMQAILNLNASVSGGSTGSSPASFHASGQSSSSNHDPSVKMARILESLQENPIVVPEGTDNRITDLHPARFLPGYVTNAKKVWLMAREHFGLDGLEPLASYDMATRGLGGCVTPRGWLELHNPGSHNIRLNQFCASNMSTSEVVSKKFTLSDSDGAVCIGDNMKEILDMSAFQHAVRVLVAAANAVMPWNQSFAALDGFLQATNYGAAELAGKPDRVDKLVRFVNYVLGLNATAWQQKEPFLSTGELKHEFGTWYLTQAGTSLVATTAGQSQQQAQQKGKNWGWKKKNSGGIIQLPAPFNPSMPPPAQSATFQLPSGFVTICKNYNAGRCHSPGPQCKLASGSDAWHICNARTAQNTICKKPHPAYLHT
jgi:hypothetical protein